jgi:UDP-N-acetylenolpyruvoylglucosamine reductase
MNQTHELHSPGQEQVLLADELARALSAGSTVRAGERMSRRTTLRVGGPADLFVEPDSEQDLARVLAFCQSRQIPFFVLGRGSNLLVMDSGFRGAVISLSRPGFSSVEICECKMCCGAGARLKIIAVTAKQHSLSGLEFLEGIPGSLGGALRMNAGAMGGAIFDVVESVRIMSPDGALRKWTPSELKPVYRNCEVLQAHIALSAVLLCRPGRREEIEERMSSFSQKRWKSQPAAPSAGCMFKNPSDIPAGKLIDELGLKGFKVGGAAVSSEHGNFIVNDGAATARDILDLIAEIRRRARVERGVELETEVQIIGGEVDFIP